MAAPHRLHPARRVVAKGGLIAYPTEAVFGLGCNPYDASAVARLLAVKRRPVSKGLIVLASDFAQLEPLLAPLSDQLLDTVTATWPGPVTWLLPARPEVPNWLRGTHDSIAVRVTDHPGSRALCEAFGGAIVSTSANPATLPPARNPLKVRSYFGNAPVMILHGPLGGRAQPSEIRDGRSGRLVRAG